MSPAMGAKKQKGRHCADLSFHLDICASTSVVARQSELPSVDRLMVNETLTDERSKPASREI